MVTRVPKATPNSQNLSHDASCFVPSKSALQTDEADENEYKTPVVLTRLVRGDVHMQSRKTSAAEPSGAYRTPDLGHFTRSVIQSLENIKFTPSQGVCTPSPTILVHHHHHVYGATTQGPVRDDQINSAYLAGLAGLAAGRADAELKLTAGHPLIPAAMYEPSGVQMNDGAGGVVKGGQGGDAGQGEDEAEVGERASVDGGFDEARSLDGHGEPAEGEYRGGVVLRKDAEDDAEDDTEDTRNTNSGVHGGGRDKARTRCGNKATSSKSKSSSPTKKPQQIPDMGGDAALHMAFALLSAHGVRSVTSVEDIPGEVLDLGSLLVTLEIPVNLIMTPANDFCSNGARKILNARQRRTLRRSQERAWKELEALKDQQAAGGKAQPVRRSYSPTCLSYGVNPGALAEYNGYVMAPHGMVPMPSPGVGHGAYAGPVAYQMIGPGHPQMANFAPDHTGGLHHGHQYYGPGHAHGRYHGQQTRTLSRFAER